jgi:hypothetical protein
VDTDSFDEYRQKTGFEEHGFEVPREQGSIQADKPLSAESPLIDKGCILPNVNDDFTGKAPDIGPYEYGKPLPHYGPRTEMHD